MNRYVLVSNIEGEALKFHDKITNNVCHKFNKSRQKLPAHFTIKAPFETDNIEKITELLEQFSFKRYKTPIEINGFGSFRRDVIYMNVDISKEGKKVYDELIDELSKISWLKFKNNEGKGKIFHCTIVSRRISDEFDEIWNYVNQYNCNFKNYFDNLILYIWKDNRWVIYKRFNFK